jgi:hypothetical protein
MRADGSIFQSTTRYLAAGRVDVHPCPGVASTMTSTDPPGATLALLNPARTFICFPDASTACCSGRGAGFGRAAGDCARANGAPNTTMAAITTSAARRHTKFSVTR